MGSSPHPPSRPFTYMSTNELPSSLVKNQASPQSPSGTGSPSHTRVYGYNTCLSTRPTSDLSSPQATPSPDLPQPPLQVHIHCYPSTQRNLQNAGGGNFPGHRRTIDNPGLSSSLNFVCTLTYLIPLADFLIIFDTSQGKFWTLWPMLLYRLLHLTLQVAEYCSKFPATVSKIRVKYSAFHSAVMVSFTC